jgi:hypothetical protein
MTDEASTDTERVLLSLALPEIPALADHERRLHVSAET